MKYELTDSGLNIIPENTQDKAWIEHVLGLKSEKDEARVIRVNTAFWDIAHAQVLKKQ